MKELGLKSRLLCWITLAMLFFVLAGGFAIHLGLAALLHERNAEFLARKASELLAAVNDENSGGEEALEAEIRREAIAYSNNGLTIVIYRNDIAEMIPFKIEEKQLVDQLNHPGKLKYNKQQYYYINNRGYLVYRARIQQENGTFYPVDLILDLEETQHLITQFDRRVLAGGIIFFIIAIAGGFLFTRRAMQPVVKSIQAARELRPDQLDSRLPLAGTGDEIDQLAQTINSFLGRMSEYHEQIKRFTADASHELRSPLAAMRATIEVALNQGRSEAEYREILATLGEQCDRLSHLVTDLLLLARADAGQIDLKFADFDISQVIADVIDLYEPMAEEKRISIKFNPVSEIQYHGDIQRIRQLLTNLLDNAIKFSGDEGLIEIKLAVNDQSVIIEVTDEGIGFTDDLAERIFDRFFQADPARSSHSAGLGLSICRWICDVHGGEIKAEGKTPSGSRFKVRLPLTQG